MPIASSSFYIADLPRITLMRNSKGITAITLVIIPITAGVVVPIEIVVAFIDSVIADCEAILYNTVVPISEKHGA